MKRCLVTLILLLVSPVWAQNLTPPPNSSTGSARPTIQAVFNQDAGRTRVWVDGTEFTNFVDQRGRTVTLVPPYNLDYGTHRVQMRTSYGERLDWNFQIVDNPRNRPNTGWNHGGTTEPLNYGPVPGSVVTVTRPPVAAIFSGKVNNVRMTVDGVDVTGASNIRNNRITWNPGYDLDQGQHNCVVTANASNGQTVRGQWNFVIRSW